jgi:hypothetical protein
MTIPVTAAKAKNTEATIANSKWI